MLRNTCIKLIMLYVFLVFGHDNLLGMYSNSKKSILYFMSFDYSRIYEKFLCNKNSFQTLRTSFNYNL